MRRYIKNVKITENDKYFLINKRKLKKRRLVSIYYRKMYTTVFDHLSLAGSILIFIVATYIAVTLLDEYFPEWDGLRYFLQVLFNEIRYNLNSIILPVIIFIQVYSIAISGTILNTKKLFYYNLFAVYDGDESYFVATSSKENIENVHKIISAYINKPTSNI